MSNRNRRRRTGSSARAAVAGAGTFTFNHHGRAYILPPAGDAAGKIKAGQVIDAVMGDSELAELRLGLSTLQAVDADPEAMKALRDKPMAEFADVIGRWMRATGADPGESPSSLT